jgi:diadenosine tetraphosphate (Ap4A) HIT family hydrolase
MNELKAEEANALGVVMRSTTEVFRSVLKPARVHLGLYAGVVRHIHWHVVPRLSSLPAGNIPLTFLIACNRFLQHVGLKKVCSDDQVASLALQMRLEFERLGQ